MKSRLISYILILTGIAAMGYGVFRGESAVVLANSVTICLECIGIG